MSVTTPPKELPQPAPVVTSWTELQIPLSKSIEDEESEDGKKWFSLTTYHNPEKTSGFVSVCFGRVDESPEKVWYITTWESAAQLGAFEKSEDFRLQREELENFSIAPLKMHRCDIRSNSWQSVKAENFEFLDAYFPSDISEESKEIVNKARGLVYHYAPGGRGQSAYAHRPVRGWAHGTREYAGQEAVVLRFVHYWKNKESEREFKVSAAITVSPGGHAKVLTLYSHLMETLKEAGLLGIEESHCKLVAVPNYWQNPDDGDEDDEEYVV